MASPTNRADASRTSTRPWSRISNTPASLARPKRFFRRAQRPVGALALALELQHAVDQVLEHAGTGQRAVLGDVPDEQHRGVLRLGHAHQLARDLADLGDRARGARQVGGVQRLHRVDHAHVRALLLDRRDHRLQIGLGDHRDPQRTVAAQPLGPQPDLRRGLLGGHVQRAVAVGEHVGQRHRRQRRLADPGRAADQDQRTGDDPAAEHAVELADPGTQPPLLVGDDVCRARPARRRPRGTAPGRGRSLEPPRPQAARSSCSTRRSPGSGPPSAGSRDRRPSRRGSWWRGA